MKGAGIQRHLFRGFLALSLSLLAVVPFLVDPASASPQPVAYVRNTLVNVETKMSLFWDVDQVDDPTLRKQNDTGGLGMWFSYPAHGDITGQVGAIQNGLAGGHPYCLQSGTTALHLGPCHGEYFQSWIVPTQPGGRVLLQNAQNGLCVAANPGYDGGETWYVQMEFCDSSNSRHLWIYTP